MQMGYSRLQMRLHWIIAGLVVLQYALHDPMARAFDAAISGEAAAMGAGVGAHIFLGFSIFALTLVRLTVRINDGVPPPVTGEPAVFQALSRAVHWGFYALLIALPVSGAVAWFRLSAGAGFAHEVMRAILLALILAHLGGVAMHRFVWKTGLLGRMTGR